MIGRGAEKLDTVRLALLGVTLALTAIGILFVHSTTNYGEPFPSPTARGQIIKAVIALAAFFAATRIDYRIIERWAYPIYGFLVVVLLGMLVGKVAGIRSFLDFFFFQVQPSELMKIALILALARYLRFRDDQRRLPGLRAPILIAGFPMVLVVLQPDLGTSLIFPPILLGMLLVAGARPKYVAITVLVGVIFVPAVYYMGNLAPFLRDYQLRRIQSFMNQGDSAQDPGGDQLRQSLIAIGSGGAAGKGLGKGTQNTLRWLPEKHTDFIYSVVGEEWGFVGAAGVALLFLLLIVLILRVAILTREPFGRLAVTGVGMAIAAQSLENMGMTLGLTPITGIPLPFVSHGGSSLVTSYLALAIAFNVAARHVRVVATRDLDPADDSRGPVVLQDPAAGLLRSRWPVD